MLEQLIHWKNKNLNDRQTTLLAAFIIGILASMAAFFLHSFIHWIQQLLTAGFNIEGSNLLFLIFPVIGIYLTHLFVKYIVKDNISHGITRVLYAISTKRSRLKAHNTWTSLIASGITIAFGGSVGAEAPIVLTGSAIGSQLGQLFKMNNRQLMVLVGCGAAAAISGIFKAPIAGLVFTLEVLMIDLNMASIVPILISSVTANVFTYILAGSTSLFSFHLNAAWTVDKVPACILTGVFCGLVSLYFIRTMTFTEGLFAKLKGHAYEKLFLGGIMLSTLIFLFPSLYGEGYDALNILLNGETEADWNALLNNSLFYGNGQLLVVYIALVLLTKVFATSATNGGGGCGGTFAPSLFIGGFSGFFFARVWNINQIGIYIPEKNFALLGMAGVMSGVMHAPLTGIFLIAEITGGYELFMPLIIVAVVSVITISIFEPHSIYAMRLARQGRLVTHHTDSSVLTLMSMDSIIEKDFTTVSPDMTLGKLVNAISQSEVNYIPVVADDGRLLGIIDFNKIRHIVFRQELYNRFHANQIMQSMPAILYLNEPMREVMEKFEKTGADYLPIININNQLQGIISRTRMYAMYRKMVEDYSAE